MANLRIERDQAFLAEKISDDKLRSNPKTTDLSSEKIKKLLKEIKNARQDKLHNFLLKKTKAPKILQKQPLKKVKCSK